MTADLIAIQNPWWYQPDFGPADDHHLTAVIGAPFRLERKSLGDLHHEFGPGDIYVVRGARQVGKTTLLKEWICALLGRSVQGLDIIFLSCESIATFAELQSILATWIESRRDSLRLYLFLDEVSFVKEWQRAILWCANAGLLRNATVVLTGSNARDLKESSERLPGRRGKGLDIAIHPASPRELRELPCFSHLSNDALLELYFKMGGFPHALRDVVTCGRVTDETYRTYQNWIIGDAARYDLSIESLRHMMYRIFVTVGSRVTLTSLIEQTPLKSHETGLRYLEHLDEAFLCRTHYCYDVDKGGPAYHKSRKIYFVDPLLYYIADSWKLGLTNIWDLSVQLLSDAGFKGTILESCVVVVASRKYETFFWYSSKTKKEIDLVVREAGDISLFDVKSAPEKHQNLLGRKVTYIGGTWLLEQ